MTRTWIACWRRELAGAIIVDLWMLLAFAASIACGPATPGGDGRVSPARPEVLVAVPWPWERRAQIRYGEGLDLAVAEVNASGGIDGRPLRLVRFDDKESVDEGRIVAETITATPGIVAVIGHLQSYVTLPAAAIYDRAGLVLLAPVSTDPALTASNYRRVFRVTMSVSEIGHHMANAAAAARFKRLAIEYVRTDYGRDLSNAFETRANELGLGVVARHSYDAADSVALATFDGTFREWTRLGADAIFLAGEPPAAAHVITMARGAGIRLPIIGGDALSSPELLSIGGRAAEGALVASFFHPDEPRPEVQAFAHQFAQRYGGQPDAGSALGYDAVRLLAGAMRRAHSTAPDRVAAALHETRAWAGVTGTFAFDDRGETRGKRIVRLAVRDGRFVYVDDAGPAHAVATAGFP